MGQNRYRLFEKNECIKIEQDIETLHNLIVPEQLPCTFIIHKSKDGYKTIVLLFLGKQLRCDILILVFK